MAPELREARVVLCMWEDWLETILEQFKTEVIQRESCRQQVAHRETVQREVREALQLLRLLRQRSLVQRQ